MVSVLRMWRPLEVIELVRARVALPKTPKKVSWEKELSLLRAKIDVLDPQITRLNKSVLFHQEKLRQSKRNVHNLIVRFEISRPRLHAHSLSGADACAVG